MNQCIIKKCLLLLLICFLFSCQTAQKVTVMVPQGSPQLAVLGLDDDRYDVEVVLGADPLVAAFGSISHDAIIAPTNLGAKLYQAKPSYVLAATLVWGNYHLISTGYSSFSINALHQQNILVFGQNQTSDIIINHLLDIYDIDATITYVDSVTQAASLYLMDPTQIVLVAEPSLSILKKQVPATQSIDCQDLYEHYHGTSSYPQASLFVKASLPKQSILSLLSDIEASITWVNGRSEEVLDVGLKTGISNDKRILSDAILGSHLRFIHAVDAQEACDLYLSLILSFNPPLIGGSLPDVGFYWSDDV